MTKQTNTTRRLVRGSLLLIVVCLLSTAGTPAEAKAPIEQTSSSPSVAIAAALLNSFGPVVEAVTLVGPFYLTGDFNGDGAQDIIVVVRIKGHRSALQKDVQLLNPFDSGGRITFPPNPSTDHKLALAVIHSWKARQPVGKYLLIGDSPILILENSRPTSGPEAGSMELMSRRGPRRRGERLPRTSKGDVILLATEVGGDSRLYWNGKTYRWADSADD